MRQIKFRAWEAEYSQMVSWEELKDPCSSGVYLDYLEPDPSGDPVIMQFTGAIDSDGSEIYEGDICQTEDFTALVEWDSEILGFRLVMREGDKITSFPFMTRNAKHWKIVGNIYENPELVPK